jgi:hypothetical protein
MKTMDQKRIEAKSRHDRYDSWVVEQAKSRKEEDVRCEWARKNLGVKQIHRLQDMNLLPKKLNFTENYKGQTC